MRFRGDDANWQGNGGQGYLTWKSPGSSGRGGHGSEQGHSRRRRQPEERTRDRTLGDADGPGVARGPPQPGLPGRTALL